MDEQLAFDINAPPTETDKLIDGARERIAKQEIKDLRLVQKGIKELGLTVPQPRSEEELWQAENTIRRKVRDYAEFVMQPTLENAVEQSIIEGFSTADELLRQDLTGKALKDALIRNAEGLAEIVKQDALRKPLASLINEFPEDAVKFFRSAVVLGHTADLDNLFLNYAKINRSATFNAYRDAKLETYRMNNHIVKGWIWHSATNERTCAVCWAMHGTKHDLDEFMLAHPNCRCSMVPETKTYRELGFTSVTDELESSIRVQDGESLFAASDIRTQQMVLGKAQYERYKNGEVRLADFVSLTPGKDGYRDFYSKKVPK